MFIVHMTRNKKLIFFVVFLVFTLKHSYATAGELYCASNPYSAIKNVKNDLETAVFIGKVISIKETAMDRDDIGQLCQSL